MAIYRILAQHMFSSKRIAKVVQAKSEAEAFRLVYKELEDANYYAVGAWLVS